MILVGGIFAYTRLQTSLFPEITFPKIKVIADAGLQPVDKMMVTVTRPLENAIKQVPDLQTIRSTTSRGSCEMSRYDGIPITRELMARGAVEYHQVLDLGCGSALYLTDFCKEVPGITAWGVEPDPGGYAEAVSHVAGEGMSERITLANRSATAFLDDPPSECRPDLLVLGYVLQEVLQQEGEEAVERLLRNVARAFPDISIAVIEVANEIANPTIMRHGLATNFWNPYFLMHVFTAQRLESPEYWERLFARTGWRVDAFVSTDRHIDSTGLELGYLLRVA